MKYVISKQQYGEIMEGPFDSFKNRMEYHLNMGDRKKYPGKPTYSMYVMMKAYQEIIDRVFKYANKEFPFEGVKGLLVATAFSRGSIMSGPEHITVSLWPVLDENNPFKGTQEEFDENTKKFSEVFNKNMELRQLHKFWPLDREKKVRNHFNISPMKISTVMLESHPEFWEHNLFIKRRLDMIKKVVTDTYAYKHPCEFFSAESFIHSLINDDIHVILWDEEFTDGQILDVKDFVEDNYKDILISYWNRRCGKSVVKEGYIPANFVKRRLEELENIVYMAMNSHDDERDFHDFVERCFEYVYSYYSDHSTLSRDYIEELVDYVGEYMFPILEKHFLEVRSLEGDKPDVVVEQFEFARIQKYWDRIEKETGFKITDEDIEREKSISGGLKFENGGMDPETLNAFKSLQNDCKGLKMDDDSYRSYDKQTDLFIESVKRKGGIKQAMTYRAIPGFSQHHTGRAIDLEKPDSLRACAKKHASKHNFIFPYEGNGVRMAEPWHIYYNK